MLAKHAFYIYVTDQNKQDNNSEHEPGKEWT
jgi:hypothetical protein